MPRRKGGAAIRAAKSLGLGPKAQRKATGGKQGRASAVAVGRQVRQSRIRAGTNPNTGKAKGSVSGALKLARKKGLITRGQVKRTRQSLKASGNRKAHVRLAGTSSQGSRTKFAQNLVASQKRSRAQNKAKGDHPMTVRSGSQAAKRGQNVGSRLKGSRKR